MLWATISTPLNGVPCLAAERSINWTSRANPQP
jgi:hypothetical protein